MFLAADHRDPARGHRRQPRDGGATRPGSPLIATPPYPDHPSGLVRVRRVERRHRAGAVPDRQRRRSAPPTRPGDRSRRPTRRLSEAIDEIVDARVWSGSTSAPPTCRARGSGGRRPLAPGPRRSSARWSPPLTHTARPPRPARRPVAAALLLAAARAGGHGLAGRHGRVAERAHRPVHARRSPTASPAWRWRTPRCSGASRRPSCPRVCDCARFLLRSRVAAPFFAAACRLPWSGPSSLLRFGCLPLILPLFTVV